MTSLWSAWAPTVMDAVMLRMNAFGRMAVCGMIAGYDGQPVPMTYPQLILTNRLKVQGFIVSEHMQHWPAALKELGLGVATGRLKYRESVAQGVPREGRPRGPQPARRQPHGRVMTPAPCPRAEPLQAAVIRQAGDEERQRETHHRRLLGTRPIGRDPAIISMSVGSQRARDASGFICFSIRSNQAIRIMQAMRATPRERAPRPRAHSVV